MNVLITRNLYGNLIIKIPYIEFRRCYIGFSKKDAIKKMRIDTGLVYKHLNIIEY